MLDTGQALWLACPVIWKGKKISYYSQFYEDAIVDGLFHKIGTTNKMLCDIGASDGITFSNTKFFMEQFGWGGTFIEPDPTAYDKLKQLYGTNDCLKIAIAGDNTIDSVLEQASFPLRFDLLNIDIDGQDYYVWEAMVRYRARIVIIEWCPYVAFNFLPAKGTDGNEGENQAGLFPMLRLAHSKGYKVVAITSVNLICVDGKLLENWKRYWDGEFPMPFTLKRKET